MTKTVDILYSWPSAIHKRGLHVRTGLKRGASILLEADHVPKGSSPEGAELARCLLHDECELDLSKDFGRLINHSDVPNIRIFQCETDGLTYVQALRRIHAREELVMRYGKGYQWPPRYPNG